MEEKPIEETLTLFAISFTRTYCLYSLNSGIFVYQLTVSIGMDFYLHLEDNLYMNNGFISYTTSSSLHSPSCGLLSLIVSTLERSWYPHPSITELVLRVSIDLILYYIADECFGKKIFWKWILYGVWEALVILYLVMYTLEGDSSSD